MVRRGVVEKKENWLMLELMPLERVCLVVEFAECVCMLEEGASVCVEDVVAVLVRVVCAGGDMRECWKYQVDVVDMLAVVCVAVM